MKNIKLATCCMFLLGTTMLLQSCDSASTGVTALADDSKSKLSYAFGAVVVKASTDQYQMTNEERDPKTIVEGIKEGLKGDSLTFANATTIIKNRNESKQAAETPEARAEMARSLGIAIIGGIPQEVEIPAESFDFDVIEWSIQCGLNGDSTLMDGKEIDSVLQSFFKPYADEFRAKMQLKMQAQQGVVAEVEIAAGAKFLAENGQKEGVVTLPSGLQYKVIKEGSGAKPLLTDKVKTHYHGTLADGTIFDSSVDRGEPSTFGVNQVISGWQEGIPLMSVGAKYNFYIPYNLAYGIQGRPPVIKPGATLVFEVELIEINPK